MAAKISICAKWKVFVFHTWRIFWIVEYFHSVVQKDIWFMLQRKLKLWTYREGVTQVQFLKQIIVDISVFFSLLSRVDSFLPKIVHSWVLWRILCYLDYLRDSILPTGQLVFSITSTVHQISDISAMQKRKSSQMKIICFFPTTNQSFEQEWDFLCKIRLTLRGGSERVFSPLC